MKKALQIGLIATGAVALGGLLYLGVKKAIEIKNSMALLGPTEDCDCCDANCDCDSGCNCGCDSVVSVTEDEYVCEPDCVCEEGCTECCTNLKAQAETNAETAPVVETE